MDIKTILTRLIEGKSLTEKEAEDLIDQIALDQFTPSQIASILTALRIKGESVSEITGFIKGMRRHMVKLPDSGRSGSAGLARMTDKVVLDIVGSGGDGKGTFNISTASSLVVAASGVKLAKHGNRAASSKCGSADVLEELGVNIMLTPEPAMKVLEKVGLVFLFAPLYHPVMKILGHVRKELGFRTVFNFLGPFLNPASVKYQLLGIPDLKMAKTLVKVAKNLDYKKLMLVVSGDGIDEISLSSKTHAFEIQGSKMKKMVINPEEYGFKKVSLDQVIGGDAKVSAQIIRDILDGKKGPQRDIVLLNSAFALKVVAKVKTVEEGIKLAKEMIDSFKAKKLLESLIKESRIYA